MPSPTRAGRSSTMSPSIAPDVVVTSSSERTKCSGWLPAGPARRGPSVASNGAGALPRWPNMLSLRLVWTLTGCDMRRDDARACTHICQVHLCTPGHLTRPGRTTRPDGCHDLALPGVRATGDDQPAVLRAGRDAERH